ncbi:MAG TPA: type II secretion system F family protein [Actinomycetota bacterium]|nr:type II secretion system F family protein [Actinomycetota bacterium]
MDVSAWVVPVAGGAFCALVAGVPMGVAAGIGLVAARAIRGRRHRRAHASRRDEQLADAITAVVSALRAGMSLPQAIGYAAAESRPPLRDELASLVDEVDVGVPLADAIRAWADRVATDDARLVAATMELHRRVGGDLPAVLDQVAASVRERVAAAREIRALTAQARLSGGILGALPVGFFAFLWLTSRGEMQAALSTPAGLGVVLFGLLLDGLAFLWIRKLLEVA